MSAIHRLQSVDLDIRPLAGRIGAEVGNIRLAGSLSDAAIAAIEAALAKHKVLFFPNQEPVCPLHHASRGPPPPRKRGGGWNEPPVPLILPRFSGGGWNEPPVLLILPRFSGGGGRHEVVAGGGNRAKRLCAAGSKNRSVNGSFLTCRAASTCIALFRGAVDACARLLGSAIEGFIVSLVAMSGLFAPLAPLTFAMMTDCPSDPLIRSGPSKSNTRNRTAHRFFEETPRRTTSGDTA